LNAWAQRCADANGGKLPNDAKVKLTVQRHRSDPGNEVEVKEVELGWDDDWRFDDIAPLDLTSPMAIPALGFAYKIEPIVAEVLPGIVADNPLREGDVVINYRATYVGADGEDKSNKWLSDDLEEGERARIAYLLS